MESKYFFGFTKEMNSVNLAIPIRTNGEKITSLQIGELKFVKGVLLL